MSLRRASLVFAAVLTLVGLGVAVMLMVLTTNLHRAAHEIGGGVESLRIGEELEFGLVSVRDAPDPIAREVSEALVRDQLADARVYLDGPAERQLYAQLTREIDEFIAAAEQERDVRARFESAFATVRDWIRLNVDQSRALRPIVARWDRLANLVGISAMSLLLIGLGGLAWWVQRRTFRPALNLVGAIERYASGEHTVRAQVQAPEEFRTIALRFNDMASTLEHQRTSQLTFLAGVAHDLRNPLTALKTATAMLPGDQPLPPEPRIRQLISRIDRQIGRLERMVYDLLDAVRIEAGSFELQLETCDMRELARATVELYEPVSRIHQLVLDMPDTAVVARVDPMRIEQVLANLVSNAIKYSPRGGELHVSVAKDGDRVSFAVTDHGVGIADEDVGRIFEPFRRVGVADGAIPGIGLGLFVTRRLVEAHGGRIEVESRPGEGSTFRVHLPASHG